MCNFFNFYLSSCVCKYFHVSVCLSLKTARRDMYKGLPACLTSEKEGPLCSEERRCFCSQTRQQKRKGHILLSLAIRVKNHASLMKINLLIGPLQICQGIDAVKFTLTSA